MIYMNPYFANLTDVPEIRTNYFKEGDDNGYFLKTSFNTTYLIRSISIQFGLIDFSNDEAKNWAKNILKNNLLEEGQAIGWMADFGEYTPTDAVYKTYLGSSYNYHNRYPFDWAKEN